MKALPNFDVVLSAFVLYGLGLLSNLPPILWWMAFVLWILYIFVRSHSANPQVVFLNWLALFLTLPKRNPNSQFVTSLNAATPDSPFPLIELLLFVLSLAALIASLGKGRHDPPGGQQKYRSALYFLGGAILTAAPIGFVVNMYNATELSLYYNETMFGYAICRNLRLACDGVIIVTAARLCWSKALVKGIVGVSAVAVILGAVELMIWALPIPQNALTRYLYDFRGGYRTAVFGIGGGAMLLYAWTFLIAIFFLIRGRKWFYLCAAIGVGAAVCSLHRTQAYALGGVVIMLIICYEASERRIGWVVVFVCAIVAPLVLFRSKVAAAIEDMSTKKGSSYLSLDSMMSRYELIFVSLHALKNSPIVGVGQNGLTAHMLKGMVEGDAASTEFVDAIVASGDHIVIERGERTFDSHNLFVSLVTESGIAGLVVVFAFINLGVNIVNNCRYRMRVHFAPAVVWLCILSAGIAQAEPYILAFVAIVASFAGFIDETTGTNKNAGRSKWKDVRLGSARNPGLLGRADAGAG